MSQNKLSQGSKALLSQPVFVHFAIVLDDGTPHLTPVWVDLDGDNVVINTAQGRSKAKHLHEGSKVALSAVDPQNPYTAVAFQGTVVEITSDGADAHIDQLAKKYLGVDSYPNRQPGEVRIKVTIRPDKIWMQPN